MKKVFALAIIAVLLTYGISFAIPRDTVDSEGKTVFTNIAVTGEDIDGVPGYIEMTTSAGTVCYLYIDDNMDLRIASDVHAGASDASPSLVDWGQRGMIVGSQS